MTGQRSNRLVCRPIPGLSQQVFRNYYGSRLILSGPYQANKSRSHRAAEAYAKTKGSRVRMLGYPLKGECLRHFTTAGSKRSLYRQPNKEVPKDQGIVSNLELLFHRDTGRNIAMLGQRTRGIMCERGMSGGAPMASPRKPKGSTKIARQMPTDRISQRTRNSARPRLAT